MGQQSAGCHQARTLLYKVTMRGGKCCACSVSIDAQNVAVLGQEEGVVWLVVFCKDTEHLFLNIWDEHLVRYSPGNPIIEQGIQSSLWEQISTLIS